MIENLIAEFIGVFFTIFVLEELMRRMERRNLKLYHDHEREKKREKEEPILQELDFTFGESLEEMARVWTHLLPLEDKLDKAPFYSEKLKEALHRGGWPLKNKKILFTTEYMSALARTFLREGTLLYGLYRMFPDPNELTKEFIVMNNCLATLQINSQALDSCTRKLFDTQEEAKETESKNLYFLKGAVQSNAWDIFAITKTISDRINERLNTSETTVSVQEMGPPTWGELIVSLFKKRIN